MINTCYHSFVELVAKLCITIKKQHEVEWTTDSIVPYRTGLQRLTDSGRLLSPTLIEEGRLVSE